MLEECLNDFDHFCRDALGRTLRPYQMAPARAVLSSVLGREGRTIAILMARQAGKNELLACLALWMLLRLPGIQVGLYAPTLPQAVDIGMRRVKRHYRRMVTKLARASGGRARRRKPGEADPPLALDLPLGVLLVPKPEVDRQDFLEFPPPEKPFGPFAGREGGSMIGAHSGEKDAEKEGYTWDLILYDEAQDLDRAVIDEEISPMGSSTSATEVFIGTPYRIDCKFYDVIQAIKDGTLPGECFEYSYEAVIPHVPEYGRFVEKKARELGRDSIAFRTQYGLEWVHGLGLFFEFDLFRTLAREEEEFLSCMPSGAGQGTGPSPASFAVGIDLAGDDPGRTGRTDYTAIAVLRRDGDAWTLMDLHQWRGKEWERQFHDISRILRSLPGRVQATIDATGMGDPFSDRLQKALAGRPISIERLKLTAASKSEVGLYAEQEIAGERVFYAAGPRTRESGKLDEFLRQVRWLVREHLRDKAVRWYVSEEKGHDDLVCAFFLAIWAARRSPVRRTPLAEIATVDAIRYG
ncbi:MAG: hypothetical protein GX785_16155 [Armatimonadetes bacterium]|nr:hypothetical protein [Armatimonadota bacterium]